MSLKVWLPLNGDLRNLGTSNAIITNSSAIINTTGKIGSCYSFAKNAYLDINKEIMQNFNNAVSICFWIKINSWNTNWDTIFQAGKGSTAWTQYHVGILRNSANYLCWTLGDGSTVSNANYKTGNITLGEWTHVTCTYGEGEWATYLNGILSNSGTTTIIPNFSNITSIKIGGLAGAYKCDCLMNDFRIYDHALSAAEVKEISQGLVLHYKLDKKYLISDTNLVTGITQGGQTTKLTDGRIGVITSGSNADTYFTVNLSENITNGTTYTLTCNASGVSNGAYWGFPLGQQSNSTLLFKIYNGYNEYTFTANDINWGTKRLFLDDANRTDWANRATFWDFQLYKNGSFGVEDSSGYNNNGEIVNTLISINDSPRYTSALFFNSGPYVKKTNFNFTTNQWTISCWFKKTSSITSSYETICGLTRGNGSDANKKFSLYIYNNKVGFVGETSSHSNIMTIDNSLQHHVCATNNQGTYKYYIDGVLKGTYTNSTNLTDCTDFVVGGRAGATGATSIGTPWGGYISDVRLYATALLDADIKKLYNTSMSIDNNQNIHSFELIEQSTNLFSAIPWTSPYSIHISSSLFSNFNEYGEPQFTTNGSSAGSNFIVITPGIYEYDYTISVNTGNQFYIGFERYDADKTSRSNAACVYTYATKPSSDVVKQRYKGTVNLSTDGVNPIKYIALRILNGWSGTTSGVTGQATIHNFSLRLVTNTQNPKLQKTGKFLLSELKEDSKASFYANKIVECAEFIEK